MTETLVVDVSPSSKEAEPQPSVEELDAARELVRQARARGVALTGPSQFFMSASSMYGASVRAYVLVRCDQSE